MSTKTDHHDRILNDSEYRETWFGKLARTIAIDFDGVIHPYTEGWVGTEPADEPPIPGVVDFLTELLEDGYRLVIFSSRCSDDEGVAGVQAWLEKHTISHFFDAITCKKPPAIAYVDDRAISYRAGNWDYVRAEISRLSDTESHKAGH